ncbi:MAG: SRPBCC family protein [Pseudomonadota bacterium]
MELVLIGVGVVAAVVAALAFIAPGRVAYTETITVNAPVANVYDDIRLQEHLMRWSAWPQETKSTCTVEGDDGTVGAKTAFFTKGKRVGYQEVVALKENKEVALTLVGPGPPHKPRLTFELTSTGPEETRVDAHFVNQLTRPFNIIWKFAGLSNWTRKMHVKDLQGLKAFSEPPHKDATGNIVGRPPEGENPFEHTKAAA